MLNSHYFTKSVIVFLLFAVSSAIGQQTPPAAQPPPPQQPQDIELNTVLMESTFLIEGPAGPGQTTFGTVFIIGVPLAGQPTQARFVLVTAAHVLEGIQGEFATLHLRRKIDASTNLWVQVPSKLQIRTNGQPIWKKHPDADVAAMYIAMSPDTAVKPITTAMLADDKMLSDYDIHPGDEVRCLGFPLGVTSNAAGFPILRSGMIASYPLIPTATTKTFLFDFRVFKGNSGGPVYYVERNRPIPLTISGYQNFHFIIGLVSEETVFTEQSVGQYSQEIHQTQLGLAKVVHASLIKQTIEMLP
jgi:S1-C subfamily serine protease